MSLNGLFALLAQTELPQGVPLQASPPPKELQSLEGFSFWNELAAFLQANGPDTPPQAAAQPSAKDPSSPSVPSQPFVSFVPFVVTSPALPQLPPAQPQPDQVLNGSFGIALTTTAGQAEGIAVEGEAVESPKIPAEQQADKGLVPQLPEAEIKAAPKPRPAPAAVAEEARRQQARQPEAAPRQSEAEGSRPPVHSNVKQQAAATVIQRSIPAVPQLPQPNAFKAEAEPPTGSSAADQARPHSGGNQAPRVELESSSQENREFDSSRHRQAALRSGPAFSAAAEFSRAGAPQTRFAELLQAQKTVLQHGAAAPAPASAHEAQRAAVQGAAGETAALRGQQADQVFHQVVQNARLLRFEDGTSFEIRLKPEFLGKIQIETRMGADHIMTTRFLVEDPQVRTLLEHRMPLLAERLGEHGIRIQSLEVHSMASQSGHDSGRPDAGAGSQYHHPQKGSGRPRLGPENEHAAAEAAEPQRPFGSGRIHLVA